MNCCRHCITDTLQVPQSMQPGESGQAVRPTYEEVHKTRQDFLIVQAAVMPTSVLPAPQGKTIIPDRARLQNY